MRGRHPPSPEAILSYVAAALLGLGLTAFVFPAGFLFPTAPTLGPWVEGDMAQHVVGQRYFIQDAWRWPLLVVPGLAFPDGVNIGLTDSIPLVALILKAVASWLPPGFHGIGLWYGIAWTLQPIAAVWCVRAAGETRWLPALSMAVISVSIPAWWGRFGHAALTGHFLLLLALGTYFILVRRGTTLRWIAATALLGVTILVHPYLFLMNAAMIAAVPLTLLLSRNRAWWPAAIGAACAMLVSLLMIWSLGYLGTKGEGGFGRFAMNLLSPIWPAGSWFLGPARLKVHADDVSGWEGYNYLGLGVLAGVVLALAASPRAVWTVVRTHGGLLFALLALTVLALSHRVGIGYARVIKLYEAPEILEQFRSSGRLFWPVTYALSLAVVLALAGIRNRRLGAVLLLAVTAVQFADATWLRNGLADQLRAPPRPWVVNAAALRPILAAHRSLVLLPRWECLPKEANGGGAAEIMLELLTLASETTIPVNTMYEARWHHAGNCQSAALAQAPLRPGEVRILLPAEQTALLSQVPDNEHICQMVDSLAVCAAR